MHWRWFSYLFSTSWFRISDDGNSSMKEWQGEWLMMVVSLWNIGRKWLETASKLNMLQRIWHWAHLLPLSCSGGSGIHRELPHGFLLQVFLLPAHLVSFQGQNALFFLSQMFLQCGHTHIGPSSDWLRLPLWKKKNKVWDCCWCTDLKSQAILSTLEGNSPMLSHIWTVKNKNKAPFVSVPADFGGSAVPALVVSLGAFPTLLFFRMLLAAEPKPSADAQPSPHMLSSSAAPSTAAGCVSVWTSGCSPGPRSCAAGSPLRFADAEPPAPDVHTAAAVLHLLENKIERKKLRSVFVN